MRRRLRHLARIGEHRFGHYAAAGVDFYRVGSTRRLRGIFPEVFEEVAYSCDELESRVWVQKAGVMDDFVQDRSLVFAVDARTSELAAFASGRFLPSRSLDVFLFASGMAAATHQNKGIISTAIAVLTGMEISRAMSVTEARPKTIFAMISGNFAAFSFFYKVGAFEAVKDAKLDSRAFERVRRCHFLFMPGATKDRSGIMQGFWPRQRGKKHGAFELNGDMNPFDLPLHCDYRNGDAVWRSFALNARGPGIITKFLDSVIEKSPCSEK